MNLSLTAALFILGHVSSGYAAPFTSHSPVQGAEPGSLSVAGNMTPPTNEPAAVQLDGTAFLVDPTMPTASHPTHNITTPNGTTTMSSMGIAARAPHEEWRTNNLIVLSQGPLSCAGKMRFIYKSMKEMDILLDEASKVLNWRDVENSIGAKVFFGTLLTYMHGLDPEFGATLSPGNAEDIQAIRETHYNWPRTFVSSAGRIASQSIEMIARYPPGKALLFSCPPPSSTLGYNACTNIKAYTESRTWQIGNIIASKIMLCPTFFEGQLMDDTDLSAERLAFKNALKNIYEKGTPQIDYFMNGVGA